MHGSLQSLRRQIEESPVPVQGLSRLARHALRRHAGLEIGADDIEAEENEGCSRRLLTSSLSWLADCEKLLCLTRRRHGWGRVNRVTHGPWLNDAPPRWMGVDLTTNGSPTAFLPICSCFQLFSPTRPRRRNGSEAVAVKRKSRSESRRRRTCEEAEERIHSRASTSPRRHLQATRYPLSTATTSPVDMHARC